MAAMMARLLPLSLMMSSRIRHQSRRQRAREVAVRRCILNDIEATVNNAEANGEGCVIREDKLGLPPWQEYFRSVQNNLNLEY